jgi:hypothetical protein
MTVKEFLNTNKLINLSALAKEMYPGNADSPSYLVRKLNDKGRPFTANDANKALAALKTMCVDISNLTV